MKIFITRLLFFILPIVLVLMIPMYVLFSAGELMDIDRVLLLHKKDNLIGLAYSDPTRYFKIKHIKDRDPDIIALGSSRILQFRDFFFKDPENFYNAGLCANNIRDFRCFIQLIDNHQPKILIVSLDQYFFNKKWDNMGPYVCKCEKDYSFSSILTTSFSKVYKDLYQNKFTLSSLHHSKHIGLVSIAYNEGFRWDGSYLNNRRINYYSPKYVEDYHFRNTFERIENEGLRFEYGSDVNSQAVEELDLFLNVCKERKIHVVAFLPPYAHSVIEKMKKKHIKYGYVFKLMSVLEPVFRKYHFQIADYYDLSLLGASDDETLDGFHSSEKADLRILIQLCRLDNNLNKYCDTVKLKGMLETSYSSLEIRREGVKPN